MSIIQSFEIAIRPGYGCQTIKVPGTIAEVLGVYLDTSFDKPFILVSYNLFGSSTLQVHVATELSPMPDDCDYLGTVVIEESGRICHIFSGEIEYGQ